MKTRGMEHGAWGGALRDPAVWLRAARIGLVVGIAQAALNQGDHWLRHEVDAIVLAKTVMSPVLSFAVAFASAASTKVEQLNQNEIV